jgi:hypothetical protein
LGTLRIDRKMIIIKGEIMKGDAIVIRPNEISLVPGLPTTEDIIRSHRNKLNASPNFVVKQSAYGVGLPFALSEFSLAVKATKKNGALSETPIVSANTSISLLNARE